MLIGIDSSDSLVEVLRGQRVAAVVLGLGFAGLIVFPIGSAIAGTSAAGLGAANGAGNVQGIARLLFTNYVFAFEIVSALLIIAAVGAMVLGHRERAPRPTQRELSERRIAGEHPSAWTGPGIYARHDAVDSPALLPDGSPSRASLPEDMSQEDVDRRHRACGDREVNPANYLLLSGVLFTIGTVGVLLRRNAIVVFMSVELMLNAVNLSLVTFSRLKGTLDGQVIAFFVMVVAAAEVVVGLAIIVTIFRTRRSASVDDANLLKY